MQNWLNKYKPNTLNDIICDKSVIQKFDKFFKQFTSKKLKLDDLTNPNLIISGPNGIGKTILVDIILQTYNMEKITSNLSNISIARKKRSKTERDVLTTNRSVNTYYFSLINSKKLLPTGEYSKKKIALVFDDISNISNPKEKEAIKAIIKLNNKFRKLPVIIIANTKHSKTVNEIRKNLAYEQRVQADDDSFKKIKVTNEIIMRQPDSNQLIQFVEKICAAEKLIIEKKNNYDCEIILRIIEHSQYDIRRLINILEELKLIYKTEKITMDKINEYCDASKTKDIDPGIFEATRVLLNNYTDIESALMLYSEDRATIPLMVHENYPLNIREQYKDVSIDDQIDMMYNISKSISESDKVDGLIYSNQCWSLQPVHGFYSCVMPSYYINSVPDKLCRAEKHLYVYTKDYNKTSIKKINNKVIKKAQENLFFKKVSIHDFLYIALILKILIEKKEFDKLAHLMGPYKLSVKEIEAIIKIDKIKKSTITLTSKQKNILKDMLDVEC